MIHLPDVTLMAIDTVTPGKTAMAMRYSCRWIKFARAVIVTDVNKIGEIAPFSFDGLQIELAELGNEKKSPYEGHPPIPVDYEMASLTMPYNLSKTSHVLFMEWDSAVLNPWAWDNSWLQYDFIGAPWIPHKEPGWPDCDETNNMGNGGFSLRSRNFCYGTQRSTLEFRGDPQMVSSDRWFGRVKRKWLEDKFKIKYAPESVGARFSCENCIYSGQFGGHGKVTFAMNNWSTRMFEGINSAAPKVTII